MGNTGSFVVATGTNSDKLLRELASSKSFEGKLFDPGVSHVAHGKERRLMKAKATPPRPER